MLKIARFSEVLRSSSGNPCRVLASISLLRGALRFNEQTENFETPPPPGKLRSVLLHQIAIRVRRLDSGPDFPPDNAEIRVEFRLKLGPLASCEPASPGPFLGDTHDQARFLNFNHVY